MTKLEQLLGPGRLQQLQMIANHTANLRMMAEIGSLVELMDALAAKIPAAQLGLQACETELRGLVVGRDDLKITAVVKRRTDLLQDLESAAKAAAKDSGELAKKVKNATTDLREQVVQLDKALHHIGENLEALKGNTGENASVAVTALVAPLASLRQLALELKDEAQTAAGLTFDWRLIRQFALITLASGIMFAVLFAAMRPDLHETWTVVANDTVLGFAVNIVAILLLMCSGGISLMFGFVALPLNISLQRNNSRQAAAMIASGRLAESEEARAREADESLELVARVDSCLTKEPAQAAA